LFSRFSCRALWVCAAAAGPGIRFGCCGTRVGAPVRSRRRAAPRQVLAPPPAVSSSRNRATAIRGLEFLCCVPSAALGLFAGAAVWVRFSLSHSVGHARSPEARRRLYSCFCPQASRRVPISFSLALWVCATAAGYLVFLRARPGATCLRCSASSRSSNFSARCRFSPWPKSPAYKCSAEDFMVLLKFVLGSVHTHQGVCSA
jgi:hypothetical protein